MRLSDYLAQEKIGDSAFAERIGVSRQALWRYKNGERRPEWDVLERIVRETGGQVTPNDFLDGPPDDAAAPADPPASPPGPKPLGAGASDLARVG